MKMSSCAIYIRISTDEDLQKWSLPAQTKELQELASRLEIKVYKIYSDILSGSLSSRPGLDELRDDMASGKFSVILVVDQDRLSRMEPIDWELLKHEIREAGVRIITPAQEIDFADEDSELVSDVFNLFARHQRRKLQKAMRRGRAEAVRNGKYFGKAPYGRIKNKNGGLDLCPVTSPIVGKIFKLYQQGLGSKRIANELNPLPGPNGGKWTNTSVMRVLTNKVHRGDLERYENGQRIYLPGVFEPTVPVELFDECNEIIRRRGEEWLHYRTKQTTNIASGLLICSECKKHLNCVPINSKFKGKKYCYYYYRHRTRKSDKSVKNACSVYLRVDVVDAKLIECVKIIGLNPITARILIKQGNKSTEIKKLKNEIKKLQKVKQLLQSKNKKLLGLYLDGSWDKAFLEEQKKVLAMRINANEKDLEEAIGRLALLDKEKIDTDEIAEYYAAIAKIDKEMTREQQRIMVHALFPKIILNRDGSMRITARIPIDVIEVSSPDPVLTKDYTFISKATYKEYDELAKKEIQKAFIYSYEESAKVLFENYLDNVEAFCNNIKIKDPISDEELDPDEKLMRSIEEQIGISENAKRSFREEILIRLSSYARKNKKFDYRSHERLREAVEKKLFSDLKDVVKITTSSKTPDPEQIKRINEVTAKLIEEYGYCPICANELLKYVGSLLNR